MTEKWSYIPIPVFIYRIDHLFCIVFTSIGGNNLILTKQDSNFIKKVDKLPVSNLDWNYRRSLLHNRLITENMLLLLYSICLCKFWYWGYRIKIIITRGHAKCSKGAQGVHRWERLRTPDLDKRLKNLVDAKNGCLIINLILGWNCLPL